MHWIDCRIFAKFIQITSAGISEVKCIQSIIHYFLNRIEVFGRNCFWINIESLDWGKITFQYLLITWTAWGTQHIHFGQQFNKAFGNWLLFYPPHSSVLKRITSFSSHSLISSSMSVIWRKNTLNIMQIWKTVPPFGFLVVTLLLCI